MKHILPILLALLLLAGCGNDVAPSSKKDPSPGGGPVSVQPGEDPGETIPEPEPEPAPEDPAPEELQTPSGAEGEAPEQGEGPEEGLSNQFITTLTDIDGNQLTGTVTFSMEFPDDWTASGNLLYDADGRQTAEILPSIAFEDESVYDVLAQRYPDSGIISVTMGGLSGNCFYDETPMPNDPDFPTGFKSEIVYYLERGNELFCMRYTPAYGVNVGGQRENFQGQIAEIR